MKTELKIRPARESDARALLEIYRPYVEDTAITFEWEVPTVEEFRRRIAAHLPKYPYLVAELQDKVVGYAYVGEFKGRAAYDWSVETSIYIKVEHRRTGIGHRLYAALEDECRRRGFLNLYACVSFTEEENQWLSLDSVRFHERLGYRLIGRFSKCGFKFNHWFDMVWMEKFIGSHSVPPPPLI